MCAPLTGWASTLRSTQVPDTGSRLLSSSCRLTRERTNSRNQGLRSITLKNQDLISSAKRRPHTSPPGGICKPAYDRGLRSSYFDRRVCIRRRREDASRQAYRVSVVQLVVANGGIRITAAPTGFRLLYLYEGGPRCSVAHTALVSLPIDYDS